MSIPEEISIDPAETHQTIECYGASGAWSMDPIGEITVPAESVLTLVSN
jgi:O-glycosyl hydrolase